MIGSTFRRPLQRALRLGMAAMLGISWLLSVVVPPSVYAAAINVTTMSDELNHDGDCSLREAIRAANADAAVDGCAAGSGADTITLPAGTYALRIAGRDEDAAATGDLDLSSDATISGAGAETTIIDAGGIDRAFDVLANVSATITDVTIQGGDAPDHGAGISNAGTLTVNNSTVTNNRASSFWGGRGSGIFNQGTLTLTNSTVSKNNSWPFGEGGGISNTGTLTIDRSTIAENGSSTGGGIANHGAASINTSIVRANESMPADTGGGGGGIANVGTLSLSRSVIRDNRALFGGGISNGRNATMMIAESTITGNQVLASRFDSTGGGILNIFQGNLTVVNSTISGNIADGIGGGLASYGSTNLNNVTITQNRADPAPYVFGGGLFVGNGTTTASNTLIAGNTDTSGQAPDCAFGFTSQGYNLVQTTASCSISGDPTGNLLNVDPRLGPLQDNGGATPTHALLPGSPAIDTGHPAAPGSSASACLPTDQRGVRRPQDGNGDGVARCDIGAYEVEGVAPAAAGKVTGGGTLQGRNGGKAHFNLAVQRKTAGGPISGNLEYRDGSLVLRQATFDSLTVDGQRATITGMATVNERHGVSFTLTVRDAGEPGRNRDTFRIELGTGYTNEGTLTGGNLQVHTR